MVLAQSFDQQGLFFVQTGILPFLHLVENLSTKAHD